MKHKKTDNFFKPIHTKNIIKLSNELWIKLISYIGKKIYADAVDQIEVILVGLEHEHRLEKKDELFIRNLEFYKETIEDYFTDSNYPRTNINYLNKTVEVAQEDIEKLLLILFNPHIYNEFKNSLLNPELFVKDDKVIQVESSKNLMVLLNTPYENHPPENQSSTKFFKKRNKNDVEFLSSTILNEIKKIFTDIAIYSELHNLFEKEKEKTKLGSQPINLHQDEETGNESKISMREIALIYFYKGDKITRVNCNAIAKKYGHESGEALFQRFTKYSSRQNRIGTEKTPKKNQNKLELFEKILPMLPDRAKKQAIYEMNTFKAAVAREDE
jgi:hypothetical protein